MIILEIFIGLVLVYFLYSLFASIIAERISLFIGMRARILRQGIDSFMNDAHVKSDINWYDFSRWIKDMFVVEPKEFKYSKAGEFYRESTVKYLAKIGDNSFYSAVDTKPSYISKENFLLTILNMLSKNSRGVNEWEKIKFAIKENTLNLEPQTLQMFQDWIDRSNDSYVIFKNLMVDHFEDSMDRVNGWYKKKIRHILFIIGMILCLIFNVDTFEILQVLSNDPEKRKEMVELAIATVEAEKEYFGVQNNKSNSGKNASGQASIATTNGESNSNSNLSKQDSLNLVKQDSLSQAQQDSINQARLDRIKASYEETHASIDETISILGTGWKYPELSNRSVEIKVNDSIKFANYFNKDNTFKKDSSVSGFNKLFDTKLDSIHSYSKCRHCIKSDPSKYRINGKAKTSSLDKLAFIAGSSVPWEKKFWGFLITAFALTLGAQFWFDLLKRLISIRGVGKKPDEKKEVPRNKDAAILKANGLEPNTSDPVQTAYLNNLGSWEEMSGFVSAIIAVNDQNEKGIKIIAEKDSGFSLPEVPIKVKIKKKKFNVPITIKEGTRGDLGNGDPNPFSIRQESSAKGWGSVGGMVYFPKLGKNVALSCGHVVRFQKSPFMNLTNRNMIYQSPVGEADFGQVENLVLSSFCDAGVIDVLSSVDTSSFLTIDNTRELTLFDEDKTDVVILNHENRKLIGENAKPKLGKVIDTGMYYSFNDFPSSTKRYYNLFRMQGENEAKISEPGDSGSLIRLLMKKDNVADDKVVAVDEVVAVGILVGGATIEGKPYSFGINITDIFDILQVEKYNHNV